MTRRPTHVMPSLLLAACALAIARPADAAPITFSDRAVYLAAAGAQTEIDFDEFGGIITNQYSALGPTFVDGNDATVVGVGHSGDDDNVGLSGAPAIGDPDSGITITFAAGRGSVGVSFGPTYGSFGNEVNYFSGATLVSTFNAVGEFSGLISLDQPIDRVVISPIASIGEPALITDLLFGPVPTAVPEPASLVLLGSGLLVGVALRRRMHRTSCSRP